MRPSPPMVALVFCTTFTAPEIVDAEEVLLLISAPSAVPLMFSPRPVTVTASAVENPFRSSVAPEATVVAPVAAPSAVAEPRRRRPLETVVTPV